MKYEAHFIKTIEPDKTISTIPLEATDEKPAIEEFKKAFEADNKHSSRKGGVWKLMCISEDNENVDYEVIY